MSEYSDTAQPSASMLPSRDILDTARAFRDRLKQLRTAAVSSSSVINIAMLGTLSSVIDEASCLVREIANRYCPANRIPPELLSVIFSLVPRPYPGTERYYPALCSGRMVQCHDLLHISRTCRYWREIALGTPYLWSTLIDDVNCTEYPPENAVRLSRCVAGPLHLKVIWDFSHSIKTLLDQHGSRVEELYALELDAAALETLAATPLPQLKHCIIEETSGRASLANFPWPAGWTTLETLALHLCAFLPSHGFPNLTRLSVESARIMTAQNFLTFLSDCPRLEFIYTFHFLSNMDSEDAWVGEAIPLKWLRRLSVIERDGAGTVTLDESLHLDTNRRVLLSNLDLPDACVVRVGDISQSQLDEVSGFAGPKAGATSMRLVAHRNVDKPAEAGYLRFGLQAFNTHEGQYTFYDVRTPTSPFTSLESDTLAFAKSRVFASLTELWVDAGTEDILLRTPYLLFPHLEHLQSLTVIRYSAVPASTLLHVLEVSSDRQSILACPSLTMLRFYCNDERDEAYLLRLAGSRAAAGHPFKKLVVGRPDDRYCEYNEELAAVLNGEAFFEVLREEWWSQLSEDCKDESERKLYFWRPWSWSVP